MDEPFKIQIQNQDDTKLSVHEVVKKMANEFKDMLEFYKLDAKLKRSQYSAYLEEGFTDEQALFLIK